MLHIDFPLMIEVSTEVPNIQLVMLSDPTGSSVTNPHFFPDLGLQSQIGFYVCVCNLVRRQFISKFNYYYNHMTKTSSCDKPYIWKQQREYELDILELNV